jgi:3-hydroxyacyl-CoA dehydrogenase
MNVKDIKTIAMYGAGTIGGGFAAYFAMKGLNHPMGPFEMMDMSGLDTFPHVIETLESLPVTTWKCPESVKKLVAEGKFGRKSGEGWHKY